MDNSREKKILIFDLLMIVVITISILSISLLSIGFFRIDFVLIGSAITLLVLLYKFKNKVKIDFHLIINKDNLLLLLLILIALFFRSEPYKYIVGGQDEGVYVNMSKAFKNTGEVFQYDQVRKTLNTTELRKLYDKNNLKLKTHGPVVPGKIEGSFLPGVYVVNQKKSKYVFQFYHLHPLWMAIFDSLFGEKNAGYSLIFFSIISIIAFYLLAFEITKNKNIAFLVGFLLAINPLHVFFSKFPVTEIMALAFTSTSFYYLVRYYNLAQFKNYRIDYLVLSALLMGGMFFTRMSGFMYIPFFYLLLILVQLFVENREIKNNLRYYIFSIFLIFLLSVYYGLEFSYPYVSEMYSKSFYRAFGENWRIILNLLFIALIFLYIFIILKGEKIIRKIIKNSYSFLPFLFILFSLIGVYKLYTLGFTDKYLGVYRFDQQWHAAKSGFNVFLYWSPFVLFEYLSPFVAFLFVSVLFKLKEGNLFIKLLLVFVLFFYIYISVLQWFIPYQYYYARYLVSEVLPYMLLFTISSLIYIKKYKFFTYLLIILTVIYSLYFSLIQFKGSVADGSYQSVKNITKNIDENDIILVEKNQLSLKTALVYYENKNVFSYTKKDLNKIILSLIDKYDDIFVLKSIPDKNNMFLLENELTYKFGLFEHSSNIPISYFYLKQKYYLYKVAKKKLFESSNFLPLNKNPYINKIGFYGDGVWTTNNSELINLNLLRKNKRFLKIQLFGFRPGGYDISKINLKVYINKKELPFAYSEKNKLFFKLLDQKLIKSISFKVSTFNPRKMGINNDNRDLGLDIKSIELY